MRYRDSSLNFCQTDCTQGRSNVANAMLGGIRFAKADCMSSCEVELVHIWNRCHACGATPIVGLRFACQTCPAGADNDLCQACYRLFEQGQIEHPSPEAREAPVGHHVFRVFEGVER